MVNKQYSATDLEAFMKLAANWQNTNHSILEGVDIKGEMQQYLNSPTMNMYKKRERTQNWNHQEKKFLLDLCRKDMRIIENKRLDAGLTAVKNKAWKIIHQKFSNQFGTDRTCNRLKEQWRRMKACTRNEILDYNNRLSRFGPEVADRKKPSPFTFEVWDFMQEAKKACKSEALDGIDYSKIPLALEEDFEYREDEQNNEEDHDMDDSRTPPQDLCDIDIKDETLNESSSYMMQNGDRLNATSPQQQQHQQPSQSSSQMHHDLDHSGLHSPTNLSTNGGDHSGVAGPAAFMAAQGGSDLSGFQPGFNMNNISATLEALNALRTGQFPSAAAAAAAALQNNFAAHHQQQQQQHHQQAAQQHQQQSDAEDQMPPVKRPRTSSVSNTGGSGSVAGDLDLSDTQQNTSSCLNLATSNAPSTSVKSESSPELKAFMDMQSKEHMMRMRILEVQLQAAKYSRDLVEINKTLALQKLQEYASKRLST
ncbi:apontic isoform X2 [Haematobia irritans]|uniref:apontic isoform X2 n=1 Tax=Haematobia irritans TaxID=7368 RepID=UPI003F50AEE2